MAKQQVNHFSWCGQRVRNDNCLNMPQLALVVHFHSSCSHTCILLLWGRNKNLHQRPRCPPTTPLSNLKSFHSHTIVPAAFTLSNSKSVSPIAAAPLWRMSSNPFTQGLSISSCRVCNTLPGCHYCTITYQIPPVYHHYSSVSDINDSSSPANEKTHH